MLILRMLRSTMISDRIETMKMYFYWYGFYDIVERTTDVMDAADDGQNITITETNGLQSFGCQM